MTAGDEDLAALWNGSAAHSWVDLQELLDGMFRPFERVLVDAAGPGRRVLDVGCGTGATTFALARHAELAVGVDVSAPMIAGARARAQAEGVGARFVVADAQRHAFEPGAVDVVVSRFGVMFFDDPVAAFANLRAAAAPGARACLLVWRSPADNPFMTAAERAAAPLLPGLPARRTRGPGQFAFADPDHVRTVLHGGGWTGADVAALDVECAFPAAELPRYASRMGPLGRALPDVDGPVREAVLERVLAAFAPYVRDDEVRFTAACWRVEATRPGSG